jgi:hypothetical protein
MIVETEFSRWRRAAARTGLGMCLVLWGGCGSADDVRVYRAPKDPAPVADTGAAAEPGGARPIFWTQPQGWKAKPVEGMRFAAFQVGAAQDNLELTVIPLPETGVPILNQVNRWRDQLQLPPITEEELAKQTVRVKLAESEALALDIRGAMPAAADQPQQRTLAAIILREQTYWFFKMTGPAQLLEGHADEFVAFIASVRFPSAATPAPAGAPLPGGPAEEQLGRPVTIAAWQVPADWRQVPNPVTMRLCTFEAGDGPLKVEVAVNQFRGVGARLDNINRWRGQMGLEPVAKEADQAAAPLTGADADSATMFDFTAPPTPKGPGQRLAVAWLVRGGANWFIKLTGPAEGVERQKPAFEAFIRSLKFGVDPGE